MSVNKFYTLAKNKLFPICRSITGDGVRKTLREIKKKIPELKIFEVASGTKVFDWKNSTRMECERCLCKRLFWKKNY